MGIVRHAFILIVVAAGGSCHQSMHSEMEVEIESLSSRMRNGISEVSQGLKNLSINLELELHKTKRDVNETVLRFERRVNDEVNKSLSGGLREIVEQVISSHRDILLEVKKLQSSLVSIGSTFNNTEENLDHAGVEKEMSKLGNSTASLADRNTKLEQLVEESNATLSLQIYSTERKIVNLFENLDKKIASLSEIKTDDSDCPSHWSRLRNSCYRLIKEPVRWKIAKFACKEMSSHLVEIYSKDELLFLQSMLKKLNATVPVWTGASKGDRGIWTWISTKMQINFNQIHLQPPEGDDPREYCGLLLPGYVRLESVNCWHEQFFLCRKWHPHGDDFP